MRAIAGVVALALVAGSAAADTVRMEFENVGSGRNVRVTLNGNSTNCFAGQLVHSFSNGTGAAAGLTGNMITFCSDLTQSVTSSGSTYTLTGIQNLPGGDPMGSSKMQAIYDMYSAAGGSQMGGDDDMAAAFQLAIWEVIYDFDGNGSSLNLASGDLKARNSWGGTLSSEILSKAGFLFAAIGSNAGQFGLLGLRSGSFQDQILQQVQIVPLPLAFAAGLVGLGVAGYVRRRRMARGG